MGLDVVFIPCRFTGSPITKKNPFTGVEQTYVPHEPLDATELKAVYEVLKSAHANGPDENGYYVVQPVSGGVAEIACENLENGCMVTLRGLSPAIEQFLFDLSNAADWVMHPAMEDVVSITTSPNGVKELPNHLPKPISCKSAKELGVLLGNGVRAWENFRNQVGGVE